MTGRDFLELLQQRRLPFAQYTEEELAYYGYATMQDVGDLPAIVVLE